jgi:hypothetical protein
MKTKTKNKCEECGGELVQEEDRLVCSICGRPTFDKGLRHKYLEHNKSAILKDLADGLTRSQVMKKWGIPEPTLSGILRRWKYKAPPEGLEPNVPKIWLPNLTATGTCRYSLSFQMHGHQRYKWPGLISTPV